MKQSVDGGVHWHRLAIIPGARYGSVGSSDENTPWLHFANRRDGWLYGPQLFSTHDGGHTWRQLSTHALLTTLSMSGTSVWRLDMLCPSLAGPCRFRLLTSTAGSDLWHVMPWQPSSALTLARAGQRHAWLIVAYEAKNRILLRLWGTTDGGRSWHHLPIPPGCLMVGPMNGQLVPYTASSLWLFCGSVPGAGQQVKSMFRSPDGGRSWRLAATCDVTGRKGAQCNLPAEGYFNNAVVTTPDDAWVALHRGSLLHTSDGGHTWHDAIPYQIANPGDGGVGPVQFVDARHGWLFSNPNLLFRTADGGRHWQEIRLH